MNALLVVGIFVWLLGLCIGSFLNVVIYRLPLGLSIGSPRWSFCPHCRAQIAWHDNLPLVGWLLLRGRCRRCAAPISLRYPLVEALTGLVFVQVYCLLFAFAAREGLPLPSVAQDWALLLSWLVLLAALVACATMDITTYLVDTRVTDTAIFAGIVAHAAWARPEFFAQRVSGGGGAAAVAAAVACAAMLWFTVYRRPVDAEPESAPQAAAPTQPAPPPTRRSHAAQSVPVLAVALLTLATLVPLQGMWSAWMEVSIPVGLGVLFLATVLASAQPRDADDELHAAIEEEAPQARRMIASELLWLAPIVLAAAAGAGLLQLSPALADAWRGAVQWQIAGFTPLGGAAFAAYGAIVAALAGWIIRIFFTLLLGREAFATGDIFILSAAGAAAGWDIALLGFLLAVPASLVGWLLSLLLKRSAMIPFGPWLALGFLLALWLNQPLAAWMGRVQEDVLLAARQRPEALLLMGAILVIGTAAALFLARWVRRNLLSEPP